MQEQPILYSSKPGSSFFKFSWITLCLLLCTNAFAAEWYKDYEAALDAIKKGRYGEAIPRLQAAISQKNQEGLNIKFYGMKFDDYLPHYYLGRAYFHQNNYQAALREFEISDSQGEIQRNRSLFQNLSELKTLASAQITLTQTPPPAVAEKKPDPAPQKPEPTPVKPEPAPAKPDPLVAEKKPDPAPLVVQKPEKPEPTIAKDTTPPPVKPAPAATEDTNLERAKSMTRNGAQRYFQGDFDTAITFFSSALALSPQNASAEFLLGCSYAAKYLLSGSSDQQSFQKATASFQKIRKINPRHPLIKSPFISPAVREIYEKTS